jgi:hypothetical protein
VPILVLLGFMGIWVQMLAMELRVANVSGAIGLHYFEQEPYATGGSNRAVQSLKWSLSSNFGSLCYCSFILTVVEIIDQMIQQMLAKGRSGDNIALKIVMEIVACLWRCLEVWIQFLTKMSVITLSVTSQSFCQAAKSCSAMLIRHNLDGFYVDVFAGWVLSLFSLACSVVFGLIVYFFSKIDASAASSVPLVMGIVSAIVAFVALKAVSGIVLVTCNTHYMCYVLDLDNDFAPSGTTQRIHELCVHLLLKTLRQYGWDTHDMYHITIHTHNITHTDTHTKQEQTTGQGDTHHHMRTCCVCHLTVLYCTQVQARDRQAHR